MIWRAWCFVAGLAPGALAGIALAPGPNDPSPLWLQAGAPAGGLLLFLIAHFLNRRPQDEPDRGARFARAASAGLLALPALALVFLQLAPGPPVLLGIVIVFLTLAFFRAVRRRAPAGGVAGQLTSIFGVLALGTTALFLLSGLVATLRAEPPLRTEGNRKAVLDHDAGIETVALPVCEARAERVDVLHGAGAHPRLDGSGQHVWFDANGPEGRRQVHRLALATGEVACLTCDEPGNNRRPAPNREGSVVLFDTDRWATWRRPGNTELQLLNAAAAARGVPSRRITYSPGPDERALFAPAANTLAWSHGEGGRYRVVSGGLVSGHGSLQV
ncbi:MAG: hypothetical protein HKP30_15300, partial [Myxococcales bacterium]|nr:hypothetical protein [Myxococcales bacterium]